MSLKFVSLLTDFGNDSVYAGVCRGVILKLAPSATVIDLTHAIPAYQVRVGALALADAVPYLPIGVHMAVVDPGVGTSRRPLVIATRRGDSLVGPDNGLLMPAAAALGGVVSVHELSNPAYQLRRRSHTFHGRDIFAPAAGHLVSGMSPAALGPAVPVAQCVDLRIPEGHWQHSATGAEQELQGEVIAIDHYGNVILSLTPNDLEAQGIALGDMLAVQLPAQTLHLRWGATFGETPAHSALLYTDSSWRLGIALNQAAAATLWQVEIGQQVTLRIPIAP